MIQEIVKKWKLNKGVLASKMQMPLGTFCNKLSPSHSAYFTDKEIIRLKLVLKEISADLDSASTIDFNYALKNVIK